MRSRRAWRASNWIGRAATDYGTATKEDLAAHEPVVVAAAAEHRRCPKSKSCYALLRMRCAAEERTLFTTSTQDAGRRASSG